MKVLLVGINAKFIHSNLAIRSLKYYAQERLAIPIDLMEFTINQQLGDILREIFLYEPEVLGISCYIWNYELVRKLIPELKALLPQCRILIGGPEVSFEPQEALTETGCDLVLCGEGEATFCELLRRLSCGEEYDSLPGVASLDRNHGIPNPPAPPPDMDALPFVYGTDWELLRDRIVYYEASRGCPFSCQYCLSGNDKRVRFRSLELVLRDLDCFLQAKVRQVKFVDRTFNCDKAYAMAIWKHLSEQDNGITNFHFELAAELLDGEMIAWLNTVRKGLFQFEIGVQSTNPETLAAIRRVTLPEKLTPIVQGLLQGENIHLHMDLIAGLPYESYQRFGESFDYVYSLRPAQLQLGFLKLLKGSGLRKDREKYQLRCSCSAPYEVTQSPHLNYRELLRLKMLAEMVELYYNSHRFDAEEQYLTALFTDVNGQRTSPFSCYEALGDFYAAEKYHQAPHSKLEYYTILRKFLQYMGLGDLAHFEWLAKFDIYHQEKAKKLPDWLMVSEKERYRDVIFRWFADWENRRQYLPEYEELDTRQLIRAAHIEVFPFHPLTGVPCQTALLFHYRRTDLNGLAEVTEICLPD